MKSSRVAHGGKTVYGARVGILMLDTIWPRVPGDTGNALTWPFPVLYKVVKGATGKKVVHERGRGAGIAQSFLDAAAELVKDGADGITTTGGFLSIFQAQLSAHVNVPVASSSLMQLSLVQKLLPPGKRVGVITIQGEHLTAEHFIAAGADPTTPFIGTENGKEFTRAVFENEPELDYELAEQDLLQAGEELLRRHPEVGALVLECHNFACFSHALNQKLMIPVYDVYTFVKWFHSGLSPRNFGYPGSSTAPQYWRER